MQISPAARQTALTSTRLMLLLAVLEKRGGVHCRRVRRLCKCCRRSGAGRAAADLAIALAMRPVCLGQAYRGRSCRDRRNRTHRRNSIRSVDQSTPAGACTSWVQALRHTGALQGRYKAPKGHEAVAGKKCPGRRYCHIHLKKDSPKLNKIFILFNFVYSRKSVPLSGVFLL